ncbi:MAG TPA: MarR family transcriptional regulator [Nocardioides sp.]|uniref:MarR family winged helix-turn-helix transcriptional regulator n=1 Tax=uncultured Nocardioides sp. TaxID=198441 RepID=UPI0026062E20|nr:MarR family transcriptional regulator [uncultured Nocardioides sp.]HRD60067.1 MarR family transcriptional regulator [Nocardioides sp.]HRI95678.1 MarR family transcriptional regulator [Nocardioides sp.]HRK44218.1 MarR family transcriptional regulator [Nocardioides sp.]
MVLLRYCESKVRERLQPLLDQAQLTPEQWRIMALLHDHPGLGAGAVAHGAVLPSASVTRHVDKLVERGIVIRRIDPTDKRRVVLALSPRGTQLARPILAEEHAVEAGIAAGLGNTRFQAFARDLGLLPSVLGDPAGLVSTSDAVGTSVPGRPAADPTTKGPA